MKSIVKHYRKQPDGSLLLVGDEVYDYSKKECPCQPRNDAVLSDSTSGGRRTVVLAEPPKGRGRPVDPMKRNLLGNYLQEDVERRIVDAQFVKMVPTGAPCRSVLVLVKMIADLARSNAELRKVVFQRGKLIEELREICDPGRERAVFAQTNRLAITRESDRR